MKDHHIRTLSWLAQSPDLNPIKNLWNVIKRKIEGSTGSGGRAVDCVVVVVVVVVRVAVRSVYAFHAEGPFSWL